jgi:hypothetical protein
MAGTYTGCTSLTKAACGPNVTTFSNVYNNCKNIQGNFYCYSPEISYAFGCFRGRGKDTSSRLNIYIPVNSTTETSMRISDARSILAASVTWANDTANNCFYNSSYNIYIYPVEDVTAARVANGD